MKSLWIVAVLVCVVLTSGVWAQGVALATPRAAGMGGAAIGVADDAGAWFQNPAGLAALSAPCLNDSEYGNDVVGAFARQAGTGGAKATNAYEITWSGWKPADNFGFGAGFVGADNTTGSIFGAGVGAGFKSIPLSFGANIAGFNPDSGTGLKDKTILSLGAMYRFSQGEGKAPVRVGLTVNDIGDQLKNSGVGIKKNGAIWNAGIAWKPTEDLLLAFDVNDLSGRMNHGGKYWAAVNGGLEYSFGNLKEWRGRVGIMEMANTSGNGVGRFTIGLGYVASRWRADFAWIDSKPSSTWTVGVGVSL